MACHRHSRLSYEFSTSRDSSAHALLPLIPPYRVLFSHESPEKSHTIQIVHRLPPKLQRLPRETEMSLSSEHRTQWFRGCIIEYKRRFWIIALSIKDAYLPSAFECVELILYFRMVFRRDFVWIFDGSKRCWMLLRVWLKGGMMAKDHKEDEEDVFFGLSLACVRVLQLYCRVFGREWKEMARYIIYIVYNYLNFRLGPNYSNWMKIYTVEIWQKMKTSIRMIFFIPINSYKVILN